MSFQNYILDQFQSVDSLHKSEKFAVSLLNIQDAAELGEKVKRNLSAGTFWKPFKTI